MAKKKAASKPRRKRAAKKKTARKRVPRDPKTGQVRGAGPGRPKGLPNKATREIRQFFIDFYASEEYRRNLKKRILDGKASALEAKGYDYAFGVPKQVFQVEDVDGENPFNKVLEAIWRERSK